MNDKIQNRALTMKQFLLCLSISLFLQTLQGMSSYERPSKQTMLAIVLNRFEKYETISSITHQTISKSPEFKNILLTKFSEQSLTTLYDLDYKERCGSKCLPEEKKMIETITEEFNKVLSVCETIHTTTKEQCLKEFTQKLERNKDHVFNLVKIFHKYTLITPNTYEALSRARYFDELLTNITKDTSQQAALELFMQYYLPWAAKIHLSNQEQQTFEQSKARLLTLVPLKKFESISRTLGWLQKNDKIFPEIVTYLKNTDEFLALYTALSVNNIASFLKLYDLIETPNSKKEDYAGLVTDVGKAIEIYMTTNRKDIYNDIKLNNELENIHLRTESFGSPESISPRVGSPSPETIISPKIIITSEAPVERKKSGPQPINSRLIKKTLEEEIKQDDQ